VKTSVFDLFKVGIGPSSSHTVGPMRAAADFIQVLIGRGLLNKETQIEVELYASLALTGKGHGTDRAIVLGLCGELPDKVDPDKTEALLQKIRAQGSLATPCGVAIQFSESRNVCYYPDKALPRHPNGMLFRAIDHVGKEITHEIYYSVGGGFIVREGEQHLTEGGPLLPFPFGSGRELLEVATDNGLAIWQVIFKNELAWHGEEALRAHIQLIWTVMQECVKRGLSTEGILPGGLKVRRRAAHLATKVSRDLADEPLAQMDWVNACAIAVNEENAAGGRVVTAPTNGAAGIVPAVAHYYTRFVKNATDEGIFRYFLTAGAIGILYKENASISGAEVGCQGEVGVACSMAAGGLVAALEGTNQQVEYAAEIGMEHNLGMTCDPIKGLVQIPCIERNAMGAVKAINACRIALRESGEHKVSLDQVIETMYRTGLDMQSRYKETSLGGLALNVIEC
jgi:L-serine dehydratase